MSRVTLSEIRELGMLHTNVQIALKGTQARYKSQAFRLIIFYNTNSFTIEFLYFYYSCLIELR